jgi:hypothetical protein
MLKEYALQPELLSSWPVFRHLSDKFGYGRGRVIARYPRRWERMVYESLSNCKPVEKKRIEEALIRLKPALYPRDHEWDNNKDWLDNAIEEHIKRPFCAIIAQDNPTGDADIICEADLDEEQEPRWKAETQRPIKRLVSEMVSCAEPLLRNAKKILFVDPNFQPKEQRFKRPLKAFLQAIAKRPPGIPVNSIELHIGHKSTETKDSFDRECKEHLPAIIPSGMKIRLVRWDKEYLHNRYILTEYGGLSFGTGLDDHDGRNNKEDDVFLLAREVYEIRWKQYQRDSPIFTLIEDDLIIEGTASVGERGTKRENEPCH